MTDTDAMDAGALAELAATLASFPSPETPAFEADPQVQAFLAGPVVTALDQHGLAWRRDDMGNVIVELDGDRPGPSLMVMGYAMTHPANRMTDPFAASADAGDGWIRGRGLAEQKGALAAAIAAVAAAREQPFAGRLILAVTAAGETGRHDAAERVVDALGHTPDATIVAIGTGGRLSLGNKGRIDVAVTVSGRASHSSKPWAGVDAIAGARQVLDQVLALDVGSQPHPDMGAATLVATAIRSAPEASHTIQDEVRMVFDRRLLPGQDAGAAFDAIAAAARLDPPWDVACHKGPHMHPALIERDGPLATAIADGHAAQSLPPVECFHADGALDAGLFCVAGKEAAMFGPGDIDLWHSDDEGIEVAALQRGAAAYLGAIRAYLA